MIATVTCLGNTDDLKLLNNRRLAMDAFSKADYPGAIKHFTAVIDQKPEHVAYRLRSISYGKLKRYEDEAADFYAAWKYRFLRVEIEKFNPPKEYGIFDEFEKIFREEVPIAFKLTNPGLIAHYDEVLKLHPKNADAFVVRGWLRHFAGSADLAINDFSRAIELRPNDVFAFYARARAFSRRESGESDVKNALADLTVYLAKEPDDIHVLESRASVFSMSGDLTNAVKDYNRLIELAPGNPEFYFERGSCFWALKDKVSAEKDFETVLRLSSGSLYKESILQLRKQN